MGWEREREKKRELERRKYRGRIKVGWKRERKSEKRNDCKLTFFS